MVVQCIHKQIKKVWGEAGAIPALSRNGDPRGKYFRREVRSLTHGAPTLLRVRPRKT